MMIHVHVLRVSIPAMSTIGYAEGWTEQDGNYFLVSFIGDHRPMRDLGEALASLKQGDDLPIAEVPSDAIQSSQPMPQGYA